MVPVFVAVVLFVLLAVLWLLGWFFAWPLVLELGVTIGLLVIAFVVVLVRALRSARLGRALGAAVVAQGNAALTAESAKQKEAIAELQAQIRRGIASLRGSRLGGRGGAAALNALPWYILIGPPGAGKTTAIRHSGLVFPLADAASASSFRGVGGTRNCDWWFTNEAILLDTAGRYAMSAADQPEWLAFLDLLRRFRPASPVNGLLVAVSLADVAWADEATLQEVARRIRGRMDEIATRLKLIVPVYVLFTKADLVAGFTELWGDLRKSERGQPWGFGLAGAPRGDLSARVAGELAALIKTAHARVLRRAAAERSVPARRAIVPFPLELLGMQGNVVQFVGALFQENAYQETPLLRGVYFTSGTQEGTPTGRLAAAMASAYRLTAPTDAAHPRTEPKSYFLADVFRRVLFPDKDLVRLTEGASQRRLLARFAVAAIACFVAVSLVLPAVFTFQQNRELTRVTAALGRGLGAVPWGAASALREGEAPLDGALGHLRLLREWEVTHPPVQLRWGMYAGSALYRGLRAAYGAAVARAVVQPAKADLEERLRSVDASPVRTTDNFNRQYDELKLYLMLTDPTHLDPEWAAPRLVRQWTLTPHETFKNEEGLLLPHALFFLELVKAGELAPGAADGALVGRVRSILAQVPQLERLYEALVRDANVEIAPVRRETIFFGSVAPFVQSRKGVKVSGAYTLAGWGRVRALLGAEAAKLESERWVLGTDAEGALDKQMARLKDLYFERYKNAWRDFFLDLHVQDPGNAEVALDQLNALSEPEWPYQRLIRALGENVVIDVGDAADDGTLLDKVKQKAEGKAPEGVKALLPDGGGPPKRRAVSPVERAFRPILKFGLAPAGASPDDAPPPTGLSQYQGLLAKLVAALSDQKDAENAVDPKRIGETFQEAFRATSALLSEQDAFTRPLLAPLLMNPITLAWGAVVQDAGSAVGARWEAQVWQKWKEKLEGKYPFARSNDDAVLGDFLDFFHPGAGTLWTFYDESLKATIDRSGTSFVPSRRFKSSIGYTGAFLDVCLKRGQEITTALFPPKSDGASVQFDVNLHSVSPNIGEVTFEVDGAAHTYRNEPERWLTITWPGKGAHGAKLTVKGAGGLNEELSRPGDFGLFRLLEAADVRPGTAGGRADDVATLVATWDLRAGQQGTSVKLDLKPARNEHPLAPAYFRGYACPRSIAEGR